MTNVRNDLIGMQYGYLTITKFIGRDKNKNIIVEAECICGNIKQYLMCNLRKKSHTRSCGCYKLKIAGDAVRKHGKSGGNHALYGAWEAMKRRCYNEAADDYERYGAIGVRVCEEWRCSFEAYYEWCMNNEWREGMQVDKDAIPKKLGIPALLYSPEMCSILTSKENNNNRKDNIIIQYKGDSLTLKQIAEKYNVKYLLLWNRYVMLKWDIEKAIITPPRKV